MSIGLPVSFWPASESPSFNYSGETPPFGCPRYFNFIPGDKIKVTGTTKGRGFTGVVKRWGFRGGPKTHGQSDRHRAPGSIGQGTTPGRVFKGKKMAGRSGSSTKTITGLKVVRVDAEKNELLVSGAVPGAKGGIVKVSY